MVQPVKSFGSLLQHFTAPASTKSSPVAMLKKWAIAFPNTVSRTSARQNLTFDNEKDFYTPQVVLYPPQDRVGVGNRTSQKCYTRKIII